MLYLIVAIIFGSLFSIVFKVCQTLRIDSSQVIMFNYTTAALASFIPIAIKLCSGDASLSEYAVGGQSRMFADIQGFLFVLGFVIMDRSVWRSGVALTMVSARSSLILPVILSWIILGQPAPEWLPVCLIIVALVFIIAPAESAKHEGVQLTSKTDAQRRRRTLLALGGVFLCYGISDFMLKVAQHSVTANIPEGISAESHLDSLMGIIFISASSVSFLWCIISGSFKKNPVGIRSFIGGLILGIVNIICTAASLRALGAMTTNLYYPLYNIGTVIVAMLAGLILFKEKIKWQQFVGIGISILAIILFFR